MPLFIEETSIPEVKILIGNRFADNRGFFVETYKEKEYEDLGIPRFVQDNLSESALGVIRGLHWQKPPFSQGKLVSCLSGRILDVALDVRIGSATLGKHVAIELNADEQKSLWIPEGFAHGFQSLANNTRVFYKVTNYWHKESEESLNPLDADIQITWHDLPVISSEKDMNASSFSSFLKQRS